MERLYSRENTPKAKRALCGAFLALRRKKPMSKIRVQALCELADVNKSTFYRHYPDVYALAEEMENDIVALMVEDITKAPSIYENPRAFYAAFDRALNTSEYVEIKEILFHEDYERMLGKLEEALKHAYLKDARYTSEEYVKLSFVLGGAFGVCMTLYNKGGVRDTAPIYETLSDMAAHVLECPIDAEGLFGR